MFWPYLLSIITFFLDSLDSLLFSGSGVQSLLFAISLALHNFSLTSCTGSIIYSTLKSAGTASVCAYMLQDKKTRFIISRIHDLGKAGRLLVRLHLDSNFWTLWPAWGQGCISESLGMLKFWWSKTIHSSSVMERWILFTYEVVQLHTSCKS